MEVARRLRRRADQPTAASMPLTLFRADGQPARVALVHDRLESAGGSAAVLAEMLHCLPQAELFALVDALPQGERGFLQGRSVRTSFLQRVPLSRRLRTPFFPFMPMAAEDLDLSAYDLVISSSRGFAKGVVTGAGQLHIAYAHNLLSWAHERAPLYRHALGFDRGPRGIVARYVTSRLRLWDRVSADRPDAWIASSRLVRGAIAKHYRRQASVLYPSVPLRHESRIEPCREVYLALDRGTPLERSQVLIDAFRLLPEQRLVIFEAHGRRRRGAMPSNVRVVRPGEGRELADLFHQARAVLAMASASFEPWLVRAQAAGLPVIAERAGTLPEIVSGLDEEQPTGLFFDEDDPGSVADAIQCFERYKERIEPDACRINAARFAPERFRRTFVAELFDRWCEHQGLARQAMGMGVEAEATSSDGE